MVKLYEGEVDEKQEISLLWPKQRFIIFGIPKYFTIVNGNGQ